MGVATMYSAGRSIDSAIGWLDTVAVMGFCPNRSATRACFTVVLSLILVAGCGPQPVKPTQPAPVPSAAADARLRNGDFLSAAAEFARLAEGGDAAAASRYRMLAALAYLDGDDRESALNILSTPPPADASVQQLYTLALAAAAGLSSDAELSTAAGHIETVDPSRLTPYQRSVYYRTLGRISLAQKDYAAAASALIAADAYALPALKRAQLHNDIWVALSHMDATEIGAMRDKAVGQETGWLALAAAAGPNLHNSGALAAAIQAWQIDHPQHPANLTLVEQLFELSESLSAQTRHVAVLLPFNGRYASAANAIRDGFLSAWYAESNSTTRPGVSFYSVETDNVNAVFDQAVADGADLIVGPLEKSSVEVLRARAELPVRTLALNVADNSIVEVADGESVDAARFFQFGLTPEDEAQRVAERAWSDGYSRALAMGPESPWGNRLMAAFAERWQELGGVVLAQVHYGEGENTYATSVKQALNIDLSNARAAGLRTALNRRIEFQPRRRADVDVIFLAGFPVSARQLLPQLRYFRAESVPVYATSHAYAGSANAAADQDLDGLRIGDMPWLFGATDSNSFDMFKRNWPERAPRSRRLFAFGMDVYRILPYLARMRHQPNLRIPGATGILRMDSDGRVFRDLAWARFAEGVPVLIDQ